MKQKKNEIKAPLTNRERFLSKYHVMADLQRLANTPSEFITAVELIHAIACATHAEYPQYQGHWNGWRPCRCKHRFMLKHRRVGAEVGDLCLASPDRRTVFCIRTAGNVAMECPIGQVRGDFHRYFRIVMNAQVAA